MNADDEEGWKKCMADEVRRLMIGQDGFGQRGWRGLAEGAGP